MLDNANNKAASAGGFTEIQKAKKKMARIKKQKWNPEHPEEVSCPRRRQICGQSTLPVPGFACGLPGLPTTDHQLPTSNWLCL